MLNFFFTCIGILGLFVGVVLLVSPIPVGVIIITLSLSMLVVINEKARRVVKKLRTRYLWLNDRMDQMEAKLERKFVVLWQALSHTRPDIQTDEKETRDD